MISTTLIIISLFFLLFNVLLIPLLGLLRVIFAKRSDAVAAQIRMISIIVPAYNEEKNIEQKIETIAEALKSVEVETEVLIGSDGSTDRTLEMASHRLKEIDAPNWRIFAFENEGKCSTINKLVGQARGDVVISTDADTPVPENAVELICRAFQNDAGLGCLSCVPVLNSKETGSQKHYWSLEDRIRQAESSLGRLIVVTGWLYAFRKDVYERIPSGVMADDLWIPLTILLKGYKCVQAKELCVRSEITDEATEVRRRKRVISGGMDVVRRLWTRIMGNPKILLLVLSHKVNRWALPFWFLLFLASTVALWPWFLGLYALAALVGIFYLGGKRCRTLAYAGVTPFLSLAEVVRKKDFARWTHTRKHD